MMLRPSVLNPLFAGLETLDGVGPKTAKSFAGLDVTKPRDLVFTLPGSGVYRQRLTTVAGAELPCVATIEVEIGEHLVPTAKSRPYRVVVHDTQTTFHLVFFHAHATSLKKRLPTGERRVVSGRVELYGDELQMPHPDHIVRPEDGGSVPEYEPIYPLSAGLTQRSVAQAVAASLNLLPHLGDWVDADIREKRGWPEWQEAVRAAHHPNSEDDLEATAPARARLVYDELLAHQITLALERADMRNQSGAMSVGDGALRTKLNELLPHHLTTAQTRAIDEMVADIGSDSRMNRLLHGDVGSGKTLVAFYALVVAVEAGGQGALMAPTEVLARQHHATLLPLAQSLDINLEILTGRDNGASRTAKLEALGSDGIQILIGTHALLQPDVKFKDLRVVVIDEQHRFGVTQRTALGSKGRATDMLAMSATPIPRSMALAVFGNMDISVLDEKPDDRKPIRTAIASTQRMDEVVRRLKVAIARGQRVFWVCPQIQDTETTSMAAAEARFQNLRNSLGDEVVGLAHGQMPAVQKDAAMTAFVDGTTSVLVATTVIEVGVDVPDASIMVVERAETFGLAQLHQLRGRVGRGAQEAACLLLYQHPLSDIGRKRLELLRETDDGFQIAEADLSMRGPGDVIGTVQSGMPRFRVADISRYPELVVLAQSEARRFVDGMQNAAKERNTAVMNLLWLMGQDKMIHLIPVT